MSTNESPIVTRTGRGAAMKFSVALAGGLLIGISSFGHPTEPAAQSSGPCNPTYHGVYVGCHGPVPPPPT